MSERGYGSESQAMPGETGPATQPYFLKPRNGAGVAALALGVLLTVRIGSYLQDHATDFNDLARCLNSAHTNQERNACTNTFLDQMKPAS